MTVSTSTRSQTFAGGQSVLTFTFRTLTSHPEYVYVAVQSSGTNTLLTYSSQYTVSVNSSGVGGTVTVSPTFGTNYTYVVYRNTAALQSSAYSDFNQFPSSTLENNLDQAIMIIQENTDNTTRAISLPIGASPSISTTLPLPTANYALAWDSTGTFITNSNLTGPSGSTGAVGPSGSSGFIVSSSTSDITVSSTSTTAVLLLNAATSGVNKILRLSASGLIPAPSLGPVLAVHNTSTTTTTSSTGSLRTFTTVDLDTGGYWSGNTYTPLIAGWYFCMYTDAATVSSGNTYLLLCVFKNGSVVTQVEFITPTGFQTNPVGGTVHSIIQCNGSTDTIQFAAGIGGGQTATLQGTGYSYGTIVRVA